MIVLKVVLCFLLVDGRQYCSPESFDVSCKQDEVILMVRATYGRMRAGRCIGALNIGCNADVLGKQIRIIPSILGLYKYKLRLDKKLLTNKIIPCEKQD